MSDDGYITTLTRIINPLADRQQLKWPPIMLLHGGTIDATAYIFSSTLYHHPEKYPRDIGDEPISSWNRSMAFTLANNGYDVWLAETRGSNEHNLDHIKSAAFKSALENKNLEKNMTKGENLLSIFNSFNYWSFSQDDIITHEIKSQIDKICQVVSAEISPEAAALDKCKVSLVSFSLSTPIALGFLSIRPDYAKEKIHRFVVMAPTFYRRGMNPVMRFALAIVCPLIPNSLGVAILYEMIYTQLRRLLLLPGTWKKIRYTGNKFVENLMMGPSAKYRTLLEQNVVFHLMRLVSFKAGKQMCQQMKGNRLQKYDYGVEKNMRIYNQPTPPEYNLSNLLIEPYLMVSATNDMLSTIESVDFLIKKMNPKPHKHIVAPQFNHLDLVAGVENDKYVNLPILEYFDEFALKRPASSELNMENGQGRSISTSEADFDPDY